MQLMLVHCHMVLRACAGGVVACKLLAERKVMQQAGQLPLRMEDVPAAWAHQHHMLAVLVLTVL